ncbi:hypothetical protein [Nonomuraea sp. NPDC048916]|uniref:hypothetical protein n=1 Tax=Nonomuraea sp. NPDC048916 TaxID=3154232 RepID=UPI0033EFD2F0
MAELDDSPFRDDLKAEPAVRPRRPPSKLTLALAAGVVLVAGVVIGIQAQKSLGGPDASVAAQRPGQLPQGYGQQRGGGRPGEQQPGGGRQMGGGTMGGTMGTVEKVEDGKVYLKAMDGSTVTVTTTGETTVQIAKPGKVTDLKAGTTVVVRGERGQDGSVSAVSISQGGGGR